MHESIIVNSNHIEAYRRGSDSRIYTVVYLTSGQKFHVCETMEEVTAKLQETAMYTLLQK
jgi:uncharacterized protein YlzI (FlbEa/FlbD family)